MDPGPSKGCSEHEARVGFAGVMPVTQLPAEWLRLRGGRGIRRVSGRLAVVPPVGDQAEPPQLAPGAGLWGSQGPEGLVGGRDPPVEPGGGGFEEQEALRPHICEFRLHNPPKHVDGHRKPPPGLTILVVIGF